MNIKPEELMPIESESHSERLEREMHDNEADALMEDVCEHCLGTGWIDEGEHDDITTRRCICNPKQETDDED